MARKPSSSHRGRRTPGTVSKGGRTSAARRAKAPNRSEARRTRKGATKTAHDPHRASTKGRSGRATRADEKLRTHDQQPATRGRSDRAPGQRSGPASRLTGGRDGDTDLKNLRRGAETGPPETSSERQGMGRGHRRNFDESDDDATTRGHSTADDASAARDSGVRRRSRAMDDSAPRGSSSSRSGRSIGHRTDW